MISPVTRLLVPPLLLCAAGVVQSGTFELNPAQKLVFDTNHLSQVEANFVLTYRFTARKPDGVVEDVVTATIDQIRGNGKKDVTVDFLSGDHKVRFPPFQNFAGNPVVMTTLERDVREMGRLTGGGSLYFRNRVRDAFGRDPDIRPVTIRIAGRKVAGQEVVLRPFLNDQHISRFPEYREKTYRLTFSEAVPGMLASIRIEVPARNSGGFALIEELRFDAYAEGERDEGPVE